MSLLKKLDISEVLFSALSKCSVEFTDKIMFIEPPNKPVAALLCESEMDISKAAKVSLGLNVSLNWENLIKHMGIFEFPITNL